jgi:hypothetical protein
MQSLGAHQNKFDLFLCTQLEGYGSKKMTFVRNEMTFLLAVKMQIRYL